MGIQINGQTDTISATDGGLAVSGQQLTGVTDINASGIITATQGYVVGTGASIFSPAANTLALGTNGSEAARLDSSGRLLVGTSSAAATYVSLGLQGNGSVATNQATLAMARGSNPSGDTQELGRIEFFNNNSNSGGAIIALSDGAWTSGSSHPTRLEFSTTADGASSPTEQMRIDNAGNLKFNSGYGSAATAYGCRAWVNFNGTGTPAIRASGNVSSITDISAGYYVVNFTTAMPDANYAAIVTTDTYGISILGTVSTSGCQVQIGYVNNTSGGVTLGDVGTICCSFFR